MSRPTRHAVVGTGARHAMYRGAILGDDAANRCVETGQAVTIADLVSGLSRPDDPPMPTRQDMVPMPARRA